MEVRASVRRLLEFSMPSLQVTCYQELTPSISIQLLARITWDGLESEKKAKLVSAWRADQTGETDDQLRLTSSVNFRDATSSES